MNITAKVGLGTAQFGLDYGISNAIGKTPIQEVGVMLDWAQKMGIRYLDTARAYGYAEDVLGRTGIMSKFKIVSKFMPSRIEGNVASQFQQSCANLHSERLYAFIAHRPLSLIEDKDDWAALQQLKEQRKVSKIGFSLYDPKELELLLREGFYPDIVQVPFNYFDRRFESHLIDLQHNECEIHVRSIFLQGLFFMDLSRLPVFFNELRDSIGNLQSRYGKSLSKVLLKYVLSKPWLDVAVIGVENAQQLNENLSGLEYVDELEDFNSLISNEDLLIPSKWPK